MNYIVKPLSNYCSCPAWKFQKKPPSKRTCKHLQNNQRSSQGDEYVYSKQKPQFAHVSNQPPKVTPDHRSLCWSRKYDGIRVLVSKQGQELTTRNGVVLTPKHYDSSQTLSSNPEHVFDAELVTIHGNRSTHAQVMQHVSNQEWHLLCLKIFDLYPTTKRQRDMTFQQRQQFIQKHVDRYPGSVVQQHPMDELPRFDRTHWEGHIVRTHSSPYRFNSRSNKTGWKVKYG